MRSLWYQSPHLNISLLMCQFCARLMVLRFCCTTEPLGGVRNLQVTDPTTSSLNVQWEAAEGNVRQYKVFYVPAAGGETLTVIETSGLELLKNMSENTFSSLRLHNLTVYPVLRSCRPKYQATPTAPCWRTWTRKPNTPSPWSQSTLLERDSPCQRTAWLVSAACVHQGYNP